MYDIAKVRALNDAFRTTLKGGLVVATQGVTSLDDLPGVLRQVRSFSDFNPDNDPHHEHDFAAFNYLGRELFWKLDYYDQDLEERSPDPTDASATTRVLTIMLAEEY